MNHIIKLLFLCLFLVASCSQEEINEVLKNHAEMEEQANSIEELCKNMNRDIVALKLIIDSSESGDYITGFNELADGSGYTISFFKSGTIVIKNGEKGDDGKKGEDGKDGQNGQDGTDGKDGQDGTDGKDGVDGTDGKDGQDGTDGKDGVDGTDGKDGQDGTDGKDGVDGTDGKDGAEGDKGKNGIAPVITMKMDTDGHLYWANKAPDGTSSFLLDNNGQKVRASGTDGIVPVIGVNAAGYWTLDYGSGPVELEDAAGNPMKAKGASGDPMFRKVVSEDGYIVFYLSDGKTLKVPEWQGSQVGLETSEVAYFHRSESRTFAFTCSGVNKDIAPVCTAPRGWTVTARYTSATDGEITVIAPGKGSADGALSGTAVLELTAKDGKKLPATLETTLLLEFKVPDSSRSFVYELYVEGVKVGELCHEFIPGYSFGSGKSASVFYPYNVYNKAFGEGVVLDNGGKVDYLTTVYTPGTNTEPFTSLFTEDGVNFITGDYIGYSGNQASGLRPYQATDNEGNSYRVMKIGTQYWMADNLRTITNSAGVISSEWRKGGIPRYAVYGFPAGITEDSRAIRNQYGLLYNAGVFSSGTSLVPKGWKIPNHLRDWDTLRDFLGGDPKVAEALKIAGFVGKPGGRRNADEPFAFQEKDEVGYWWFDSVDGNDCWALSVNPSNVAVSQCTNTYSRGFGFSIRFIRQ